MKKNLNRLQEIKANIRLEYAEMDILKKDIVKEMVETDIKVLDFGKTTQATLVWVVENKLDYDKLMKLYPDIYKLGLRPTFSTKQALNSVSPKLLNKIIKDCTKTSSKYKLKVGRKK
jgi:predicted GTPase